MRSLSLSKNGINKVRSQHLELKASDFEDSIKPLPPGEWIILSVTSVENYFGFINPMIDEKYSCAHVLGKISQDELKKFSAESYIKKKIEKALDKRNLFSGYERNSRLFYGLSDGLPGLIIDQFENGTIIQINTAGIDRYRDSIKNFVAELLNKPAYLLDNQKYREKESLPFFSTELVPDLNVLENGLKYIIRSEVIQKIGFYFDHRENRYQLTSFLARLKLKPKNGIDLFSYVGAWGMTALKAGVQNMKFIDQGDFEQDVKQSLKLNGFEERGSYTRSDVFKYLDEAIQHKTQFDLILCDPPAFAKSANQKVQALEGYSKLHRKVFKLISHRGVVAFSSCTHYVNHEEFQKNIIDAAAKENKKIQLLYTGMQGFDHPISSLADRSNYIKSYFYIVE